MLALVTGLSMWNDKSAYDVQLLCSVICDFYCIVDDAIILWLTLHKNCWILWVFYIYYFKAIKFVFNVQFSACYIAIYAYVRALTAFLSLLLNWAAKQSKASECCNVSNLCYEYNIEVVIAVVTFWIKLWIRFDFVDKIKGIISVVSRQNWT